MFRIGLLIISLFVLGCGREEKPDTEPSDLFEEIVEWVENEMQLVKKFPSTTDCDGLLWSGLAYGVNCKLPIDEFKTDDGRWTRRPSHDCYEKKDSRSQISTDSLTGLFAGSYYCGETERLEDLADYGEDNDWWMGGPKKPFGEAQLSTNGQAVLGAIIDRDYGDPVWGRVKPDYAKHIQSWLVLLEIQARGYASKIKKVAEPKVNLKKYAKEDPDDYFISTVKHMLHDGSYDEPIQMLLDGVPCPSYVRGDQPEKFCKVHKLFTAKVIIAELKKAK